MGGTRVSRRARRAVPAAAVAFPQIDMSAAHAEMSAREVADLAAAPGELHHAAARIGGRRPVVDDDKRAAILARPAQPSPARRS